MRIVDRTYDHLQDAVVMDWFLDSCDSIRYAFHKAHAADSVRIAFILAYYKAHFPKEFEMGTSIILSDPTDKYTLIIITGIALGANLGNISVTG